MSDDPKTSPGEIARLRKVAEDQVDTNHRLLIDMAVLMDRSERSENWQDGSDAWRADHDRSDTKNFAEIRGDITALKASMGSVSSSVATEQLSSRYTLKEMIGALLALCGAIAGLIAFIALIFPAPKP